MRVCAVHMRWQKGYRCLHGGKMSNGGESGKDYEESSDEATLCLGPR